jgi:hypothetical protein
MALSSSGAPPEGSAPDDRLDSWKEIAGYLKRDVTTVQRWEKREGMPVHRHVHDKMGSVYAFRSELNAWSHGRTPSPTLPDAESEAADPSVASVESPAQEPASHRWKRSTVAVVLTSAALLAGVLATAWELERRDYFWRNPLADAHFQNVTDFGGTEQAAAISRDGKFIAFLSDRDGSMDVWVTQVDGGQSYNLTHGRFHGLGNPSLRMLGF